MGWRSKLKKAARKVKKRAKKAAKKAKKQANKAARKYGDELKASAVTGAIVAADAWSGGKFSDFGGDDALRDFAEDGKVNLAKHVKAGVREQAEKYVKGYAGEYLDGEAGKYIKEAGGRYKAAASPRGSAIAGKSGKRGKSKFTSSMSPKKQKANRSARGVWNMQQDSAPSFSAQRGGGGGGGIIGAILSALGLG